MRGDERAIGSRQSALRVMFAHEDPECCVEGDVVKLLRGKGDDD
jgi:hypothetical protein